MAFFIPIFILKIGCLSIGGLPVALHFPPRILKFNKGLIMDLQAETCGININLVDNLILYILFQINTHTRLLPTNCTNI